MNVAAVILTLAYPFLICFGWESLGARGLAFVAAGILGLRLVPTLRSRSWGALKPLFLPAAAVAGLLVATAILDTPRVLLFLPVGINAILLVSFARTLRDDGPTMIEVFARMQTAHLSPAEIRYCRSVTIVWCGFFLVNGSVAAVLAAFAPVGIWTLYTGAVSYLAIGLLFGIEYLVRSWRFRRYEGAITDPILRRIFPPKPAA